MVQLHLLRFRCIDTIVYLCRCGIAMVGSYIKVLKEIFPSRLLRGAHPARCLLLDLSTPSSCVTRLGYVSTQYPKYLIQLSYPWSLPKTLDFVWSFAPFFTTNNVEGAFQWCQNPQFWWIEAEAFDFGQKDGYITMNFMANFWRYLKWCCRKFDKKFIL